FSSRRRHTRSDRDWSSDVCSSDLTLLLATHERAWLNFRLGPSYPVPFPGLQFPVEAMEQYTMQLVPNAETSLAGIGANTVNALRSEERRVGKECRLWVERAQELDK